MNRTTRLQLGGIRNIVRLSALFHRPVVIVDIEHSGYKDDGGITEFAAIVIDRGGLSETVNALLDPGEVKFNPYALKMSGISRGMLKRAGGYRDRVLPFIDCHSESLWVGFNSGASDLPHIRKEHSRFGGKSLLFPYHIDMMKVTKQIGMSGSLSERYSSINASDTSQAHIAMTDVIMTADLFDHSIPLVDLSEHTKLLLPRDFLPPETPVNRNLFSSFSG